MAQTVFLKNSSKIDLTDHLQLFQDTGWEHVAELSSWHYFW
ncbi:MAG TPA: hypothetical protein VF313_09885 [Anaerolineaceae bacterium]